MALDPGGGETMGGGGSGYGSGPPDGSNEIRLMLDTTFGGHTFQVWTYGLFARVKIGPKQMFFKLPNLDALVNAVSEINRKYGGGG